MAETKTPKTPKGKSAPRQTQQKKKGGIRIKLVRSVIGTTRHQREVVKGLGLRHLNHTVERMDTPEIRGMIDKVSHIVQVIEA